ncbi:N-acetyltransferase family protein [Sphingobacterium spiritivorum]|uniref:Acetyltransferase, GNAT family n=1 Tax=Sphingobacterium spiritivorum ATCC 33861 TaxID=525373 RepID=D7VRJ0_SPHSI|nr:GNAT family N-acetyltransferase [Sphingobacterium spiritivorum]EFK56391.1 acetyltransferase, GNAT family [Sphingobacterium spiritivorum ATCC 33861]QQT35528.1 GNAT family N-acetyltransferase [Sphingobacterium spiritivorum]WQD32225.1 GNAT family N-acetyltransferase [Sphingobacterium spiritivorum]SUJ06810.1 ribosomal-protein-alanine acetyltransferase [Sphingobacterium spiritivorum]
MQEVIIREAVKTDCPAMLELIKELALFEKAPEQVTVTMEEFEESGFGNNPVWGAFVAEVSGNIVGISLYYIRYSTWKGRRLYLEDLIVTEQMRGTGIGKKLLDQTVEYSKSKGYSGMMWQVLDWNTPAIEFYKKYQATFDGEWLNVSINH